MLVLVITSGKRQKNVTCQLMTRTPTLTPARTTLLPLDPDWGDNIHPSIQLAELAHQAAALLMDCRNPLCLEAFGLPEGTSRVQRELQFSLSSQIYTHGYLWVIDSPLLFFFFFEERKDPTHEWGEPSPPTGYLC